MSEEFWEHRDPDRPKPTLVDFIDIYDDTLLRVNNNYVRLYQALYDIGDFQKTKPSDRDLDGINVYMAGVAEPLYYYGMGDEDIASLNEGLDCFLCKDQEFVNSNPLF